MTTPHTRGSGADDTLETVIQARLDSLESGNYRANNELVLQQFREFLERDRDVARLRELTVLDCRRYAQWLRARAKDDEDPLAATSAHANGPYFTIVRAFLGWCVDDERIETNPARPNRVKEALPEYRADHDRQFWSPEARAEILEYVENRAYEALDDVETDKEKAFRDRALVTMLALTGARGAELFADPRDEYRNGLTWQDVDLQNGVAFVFGKTRERQPIPLMDRVLKSLERQYSVQNPPTDDWPVFRTRHRPSIATAVREGLAGQGFSPSEIEAKQSNNTNTELLRKYSINAPPLSKNGARTVMKSLCGQAEISIDGEYLKPHGGRRSLGSQLYEQDAELAQELLRHESIETTHESYREQNIRQQRERLEDILQQ